MNYDLQEMVKKINKVIYAIIAYPQRGIRFSPQMLIEVKVEIKKIVGFKRLILTSNTEKKEHHLFFEKTILKFANNNLTIDILIKIILKICDKIEKKLSYDIFLKQYPKHVFESIISLEKEKNYRFEKPELDCKEKLDKWWRDKDRCWGDFNYEEKFFMIKSIFEAQETDNRETFMSEFFNIYYKAGAFIQFKPYEYLQFINQYKYFLLECPNKDMAQSGLILYIKDYYKEKLTKN